MKIVQLTAENVKKVRAVEITPKGEIVTISGKNGQGKTSVLDCIWLALDHTKVGVKMPIRKGEKKAHVRLDLGDLVVERRFTEAGSQLVVENKQGARYPSPQRMLDELIGRLSFDPLAFARMPPREQFDELRKIVNLDVDLEQLDGLNRADYAKRADINRDARAKRAQAEGTMVASGLPDAQVDENEILNRIQEAGEKNALIERNRARRQEQQREISLTEEAAERARARAADLRKQAEAMDAEAAGLAAKAKDLSERLAAAQPLPEPIDVAEIRLQLDNAKMTNRLIAARERRRDLEREAEKLEKHAQDLTDQMEARVKVKADAISKAAMPVDGLGFGEGIVTYRSIPFEQCSSAEQLRVSLSIAMAANPKLRVLRIQDGSLLDEDSLAAIAEMAKAGDYQVWIERVDTTGKIGVVIEDGAVVSVDGAPVPAAA
jgi:ABC-type histidine transport system ATPase subunit